LFHNNNDNNNNNNAVIKGQDGEPTESAKRRRVEFPGGGIMAVAAGPAPSMVSGLALAAAQAMQQQQQQQQQNGRGSGGRRKSQAQIDRRRERNRILARRTRLRKKFFFESLQKEVMDMQAENLRLKGIVREHIEPEAAKKILDDCDALERMPPSVLEACNETDMDSQDFNLVQSIQKSQHAFIITDPSLHDNPIVFASPGFLKLTGYEREQVLGRNCRFLQGSDTSTDKVDEIRKALSNGEDVGVTLVNYRADGSPFWNKLFIAALRDANNNIVNYIGVTVEVSSPPQGDPEHGKMLRDEDDDNYEVESAIQALEGSITSAVAASVMKH